MHLTDDIGFAVFLAYRNLSCPILVLGVIPMNNTDLKFFTNEPERDLYSRFAAILKSNTQFFDVLVGYFRASGFFKMYEALESTVYKGLHRVTV